MTAVPTVLVCPDKFKGTADAAEVAEAIASEIRRRRWLPVVRPLADGGDGTLDALSSPNRSSVVTGPHGRPVTARWYLDAGTAIIEAAECCGLVLASTDGVNDPVAATSVGVGELIRTAMDEGATRILVAVGGVATTDGGEAAARVVGRLPAHVDVEVLSDVTTAFTDAAERFGPQKGATAEDVQTLTLRLAQQRDRYLDLFHVDVNLIAGTGAAGGLAGGLAAIGARIVPGFDAVADAVDLDGLIRRADLVITGEGRLDETSFSGKVVGGVLARSNALERPVLGVVGSSAVPGTGFRHSALDQVVGTARAFDDTLRAISETTRAALDRWYSE
ncbi:glycerate kinase [Microbacterium sp.]|uniref:glycerate kinase n=1 Tax=Microbacterium sp. TaxID=51671 RepID=UPI0039E61208